MRQVNAGMEKREDDKPLFDIRFIVDDKSGERWAEALCVFCGKALFKITKENVGKGVPKSLLYIAAFHVALMCPGTGRRKSPRS